MTGVQTVFQQLAFDDDLLQQGCSNAHERRAAHNATLTRLHGNVTFKLRPLSLPVTVWLTAALPDSLQEPQPAH